MNKPLGMLFVFAALTVAFAGCRSSTPPASQVEVTTSSAPAGASSTPVDRFIARAAPVADDPEGALNNYVLQLIDAYPRDGSYVYRCEPNEHHLYSGVTQDLFFQGRRVAKGHPHYPRVSYCCGLTFEIFIRAMQMRNRRSGIDQDDFNGMTFDDLFNMLQIWYIEGKGDSPARAIELYGLGRVINEWEEARAGDFCDFSRNNKTGHSVIFLDWKRNDAGAITGLRYFSSNTKTGPAIATEYFSDAGGKLLRQWTRIGRVGAIEDYKRFDRKKIPRRSAYPP